MAAHHKLNGNTTPFVFSLQLVECNQGNDMSKQMLSYLYAADLCAALVSCFCEIQKRGLIKQL